MKTNRRKFFIAMFGNAAWFLLPGCGKDSTGKDQAAANGQSKTDAVVAYEEQNKATVDAAVQLENRQRRMAEAAAQTENYRWQIQYSNASAWSKYISDHQVIFMKLRKEASLSASGTAPCIICDGRGQSGFCLVCKNTGKCPTCNGTGALATGALCPTCQNTSKCFLCHGSGKMPCPFCDDGSVYAMQPMPPDKLPI